MDALKWIVDALKKGATDLANDPAGYIGSAARDVLPKPQPLEYDESGRTVIPKTVDQAGARWLMDNFGLLGMTVYHGSPHKFSKFDMSKMGTGEGAQAYGHGLYFAEAPDVAKNYMPRSQAYEDRLMSAYKRAEKTFDYDAMEAIESALLHHSPQEIAESMGGRAEATQKQIADLYNKFTEGAMYKADIPDEAVGRMLDWDAPLSGQSNVIDAVRGQVPGYMQLPPGSTKASDAYYALAEKVGPEEASRILREAGIPGIKYFDGQSRAGAEGTRNFVLFDDQMPRILEINGQPTGAQPWKAGEYDALIKALRR